MINERINSSIEDSINEASVISAFDVRYGMHFSSRYSEKHVQFCLKNSWAFCKIKPDFCIYAKNKLR